jgi:Ca2+-binding RTX toxin-like protein
MRRRYLYILLLGLLLAVMALGIVQAATNSVGPSGLRDQSSAATANELKPPECNALNLAGFVIVTPGVPLNLSGTSNDLILGSSAADTVTSGRGRDCIVGGGGNDTIRGNQGNDVLLGGPGNDSLDGDAGTGDVCYGGSGTDSFTQCETVNDP